MKKAILFSLLTLLFACKPSSDSTGNDDVQQETDSNPITKEAAPKSEEAIIAEIRAKFGEVNQNASSYRTQSREITGESTEGGELVSYHQGEELKKLVATYYGEMGKSVEEYYFSDGMVFFAFNQVLTYDKPMYVEGSTIIKTDENRYYFYQGQLIKWLDPSKAEVARSNFARKGPEVLERARALEESLGRN